MECFDPESGHVVDHAVEFHMKPPQAVMEQSCQVVVNSCIDKMRTEWMGKQAQLLVIAYNNPKRVVPLKAQGQQGRTDRLQSFL